MKMRMLIPLALLSLAAAAPQANLPPVPANGEMGFILTEFAPAIYQGKEDCPHGLAGTIRENYLASLAAPERARLSLPANEALLTQQWKGWALGPDKTNLCANPDKFPQHMITQINQGKVAHGLDLDKGQPSCGHSEFTSPSGETGVDNQVYRVMGCTRNYRGVDGTAGDIVKGDNGLLATGEHSMVLLVRGIDNLQKDDDVDVIFASTDERPILDTRQNFVTGASYNVSHTAAFRNVTKGRIDKGILTTEPIDMRLRRAFGHGGARGAKAEWELHGARLQLAFQGDGSVKGLLGAYQTPRNVIISTIAGGIGAATVAGIDCAAQYNAMLALADGGRDPKTGQCTMVSTALNVAAVPAFVFDRPPPEMAEKGDAK